MFLLKYSINTVYFNNFEHFILPLHYHCLPLKEATVCIVTEPHVP